MFDFEPSSFAPGSHRQVRNRATRPYMVMSQGNLLQKINQKEDNKITHRKQAPGNRNYKLNSMSQNTNNRNYQLQTE